jgi:hypothetical protein
MLRKRHMVVRDWRQEHACEQKKLKSITWLYQTLPTQELKALLKDFTRSNISNFAK